MIDATYAVWWKLSQDDGSSSGTGYAAVETTSGRSGTSVSPGTGHGSPWPATGGRNQAESVTSSFRSNGATNA